VDVVRHPLVQKIVVAYEARDEQLREQRERDQFAREERLTRERLRASTPEPSKES